MFPQTTYRFNLHIPGLLAVLAGSLYSNSKVGLRELIQNAHDSCIRRRMEAQEPDYHPRIHIQTNKDKHQLTITDNGHGLSADDIGAYLATIGRSYTNELKNELSVLAPEEAAQLIGQFGFGFLSAFLLADTVYTTSPNTSALCKSSSWRRAMICPLSMLTGLPSNHF